MSDIIPFDNAAGQLRVLFNDARRMIVEAEETGQVRQVLVSIVGLAAAAREAGAKELEADAAELKLEAERKLGQLMAAQKKTIGFNKGGGDQRSDHRGSKNPGDPATLAEAGIDKNLAKRARAAAKKSDAEFEAAKEAKRTAVLTPKPPKNSQEKRGAEQLAALKKMGRERKQEQKRKQEQERKQERERKTAANISELKVTITSLKKEKRELESKNTDLKKALNEKEGDLLMRDIEIENLKSDLEKSKARIAALEKSPAPEVASAAPIDIISATGALAALLNFGRLELKDLTGEMPNTTDLKELAKNLDDIADELKRRQKQKETSDA
jgi:hypothetical protein